MNVEHLNKTFLIKEEVQAVKEKYVKGTKVKLIKMNDIQAPPPNTIGEVIFVDDIGQLHIQWETGSTLALIMGEDKFEILEKQKRKDIKICARCGKEIEGHPAISRKDNRTEICSNCGILEALQDYINYSKELNKNMRNYESVVILTPKAKDEEIKGFIETVKDIITSNYGIIAKVEELGLKKLAYEINKAKKGYYILFEYEVDPSVVSELERNFRIKDEVMKFITIVKED